MSDPTPPKSPEEFPAAVRKELNQEAISHEGEARPADAQGSMSQHLGAAETEPTPVTPPMSGPEKLIEGDENEELGIDPRQELTGG